MSATPSTSRSITYLVVACATLFSTTLAQTVNRCMPFFTSEKLGFDLVKIDTANQNKMFSLSNLNFLENVTKPVVNASIYFRLCNTFEPPAGCPKDVPQVTGYFQEGQDCRPLNMLLTKMEPKPLKDSNGKATGVVLDYNSDTLDANMKKAIRYNLKFKVTCDQTGCAVW